MLIEAGTKAVIDRTLSSLILELFAEGSVYGVEHEIRELLGEEEHEDSFQTKGFTVRRLLDNTQG